jgi:hypothetical protein
VTAQSATKLTFGECLRLATKLGSILSIAAGTQCRRMRKPADG